MTSKRASAGNPDWFSGVAAQLQNLGHLNYRAKPWNGSSWSPTPLAHTQPPRGRKGAINCRRGLHPATQQFSRSGGLFSFLLPRKQMGRTRLLNCIAVSVFRRAMLFLIVLLSKSSWMIMVLIGYSFVSNQFCIHLSYTQL